MVHKHIPSFQRRRVGEEELAIGDPHTVVRAPTNRVGRSPVRLGSGEHFHTVRVDHSFNSIDSGVRIAAYTIDGARHLNHEVETGSIEPGKKADLAVLDRNIVELYESGNGLAIAETQVDLTLFEGEVIYLREADSGDIVRD